MSEDIEGWCEAAEVLDTRKEKYEEVSDLTSVLPDGFRAVEVSDGGGFGIEKKTTHLPKWVPVAKFTDDDAKYEWADDIQKQTDREYRCVVDHSNGEVYLEVRINE